jgi:hypothetical protein
LADASESGTVDQLTSGETEIANVSTVCAADGDPLVGDVDAASKVEFLNVRSL